jgi:hypothetical protein
MENKNRETTRFSRLVSLLHSPAFAIIIVVDWDTDVKAYLEMCKDGLPEECRPKQCGACESKRRPHRHGKFTRYLFTITEVISLTIFRFLCPDCGTTSSVIPSFVQPHHQTGVEVKEAIIVANEEGVSLSKLADRSLLYAGGVYAEKTLCRWRKDWNERRNAHEEHLWEMLFRGGMDAPLPRERHGPWKALREAWRQATRPGSLFSALLRLGLSAKMTARP